jgi:hypothetical protein
MTDLLQIYCTCTLELELSSPAEARRVAAALEPDNEGFVETKLNGNRITATAEAGSITALLHTLDDYLACFGIAAGVKGRAAPAPEDGRGEE